MKRRRVYALLPVTLVATTHALTAFAQDAPESLQRCADEADDKRRLACYDQEMARLRAPNPAPSASIPAATSAPAVAAATSAPAVTAATSAPVTTAATAAPAVPAATAAKPDLTAEEQFGLSQDQVREKQSGKDTPKLDHLAGAITKISKRPRGELVMTLDNGQVWTQQAVDTFDVRVGDTVTIKAAALGSFKMSTKAGRSTRVTRVQ
jgi:hypothetical protein